MAKEKNPHLKEWMRTFKNVGSTIGSATLEAVSPYTSHSITNIRSSYAEGKDFVSAQKSKIDHQLGSIMKNTQGRDAQTILKNAFNDIKNGNFSLDQLTGSSLDSIDDFDDMMDFDVDTSDPTAASLAESKKNTAILGKAVTEANAASIEGMKHMTTTLSNINIKTSQAMVKNLSNVAMLGINQMNVQMSGVNSRLDQVNENLSAIIRFQNENTLQVQKSTMDYFQQTTDMMNKMGQTISELHDYMSQRSSIHNKRKSTLDDLDFSMGFDPSEYAKMIKKNFNGSMIGSVLGLGSAVASPEMLSMMGPVDMFKSMILPGLIGGIIPKHTKKSFDTFDKTLQKGMNNLLYRLGDMADDPDTIKSAIGTLLGKKRPEFHKASLGNFKKGAMSWNGVAQKTLVEVIPSYLARIESALTKREERHYNMDTGNFMTQSQIEKDFMQNFTNTMEYGMSDFRDKTQKYMKGTGLSKQEKDTVNQLIYNQLLGGTDKKSRQEVNKTINSILSGKMSASDTRDAMMSFQDALDSTIKSTTEFMKLMEDDNRGLIYRHLHNTYGKNTDYLYRQGDILSDKKFYKGKDVSMLSESELKKMQKEEAQEKALKEKKSSISNKIKSKVPFLKSKSSKTSDNGKSLDSKVASKIDDLTGVVFSVLNGYGPEANTAASSAATLKDVTPTSDQRKVNSLVKKGMASSFSSVKNKTLKQLNISSKEASKIVSASLKATSSNKTSNMTESQAAIKTAMDNTETLKALVVSQNENLLKPMAGGLIGKEGALTDEAAERRANKIKDKLFNEKDGIFRDVPKYMKYLFTGKGYTNRNGKVIDDRKKNNVKEHLGKGYQKIFDNTMIYLFGEKYKEKEDYQKYFSWLSRDKSSKVTPAKKASARKEAIDNAIKNTKMVDANTANLDISSSFDNGQYMSEEDVRKATEKSIARHNKKELKRSKSKAAQAIAQELGDATAQSAQKIAEVGDQAAEIIAGKDPEKTAKKAKESIFKTFKKHLPKDIAGGIVGAGVGALTALQGGGLLGSLFLPGGPISGAIVGVGLSIASRSKALTNFIFGEKEDKDGKKANGLISSKTQQFFKKNAPLLIGAATLGGLKGVLKTAIGGSVVPGPGGFLLNTLLPGGIIGGALFALGTTILKNNDKFNEILFGKKSDEKDQDGKLGKSMSTARKIMEKSGHFVKGGLKGLAAGAGTGLVLSKMGIVGSALSLGGPVGMGLMGLGIGIASQTKKFQEMLFGTEDLVKDPKTGEMVPRKQKNGLMHKVRNVLVNDVFEPIKDQLQDEAVEFASWAKKQIMIPFRAAFGPILSSFATIKKDISDAVHEAFNNIAETVGKAIKSTLHTVFSPFTKIAKLAGKGLLKTTTFGLKAALSPVSVPLKVLALATHGMRKRAMHQENDAIRDNLGYILNAGKAKWNQTKANNDFGSGFGGWLNKNLTHIRDYKDAFGEAREAYEDTMSEYGQNQLGFLGLRAEKKRDKDLLKNYKKERGKWKGINAYRKQLRKEKNNVESYEFTQEKLEEVRNHFARLGINKDYIKTNADLNDLLFRRDEWKDKWLGNEKGGKGILDANQKAQSETRHYQHDMLDEVTVLRKEFVKYATRDAIKNSARKLHTEQIKTIDKDLQEAGLTWDELGVDPVNLIKNEYMDDNFFQEFMKEKYKNDDIKDGKSDLSDAYRDYLKHPEKYNKAEMMTDSTQEQQLNALNNIAQSVNASATIDQVNQMDATGASKSQILRSTGKALNSDILVKQFQKNKRMEAKLNQEADESAKAQSGGTSLQDEDKDKKNEAGIDDIPKKEKYTVADSVKGFFKDALGSIAKFVFSKDGAVTLAAAGLFGEQIAGIGSTIWNFVKPKVLSLAETVGKWWDKNGTNIISGITSRVVNNMGFIIDNLVKVGGAIITTIAKKAVNGVAAILHLPQPFKDKNSDISGDRNYTSESDAKNDANYLDKNYTKTKDGNYAILGDGTDIDENGDTYQVGNSGLEGALIREPLRFATSKTNRKLITGTAKGALKFGTWVATKNPVTGIAVKTAHGVKGAASFTKNVAEGIINSKRKSEIEKVAKAESAKILRKETKSATINMAENTITKNLKASIKTDGSKAVKAAIKKTSQKETGNFISKFLKKIKKRILSVSSKLTKWIPENKFIKVITNFLDKIDKKCMNSSNVVLQKISNKINKAAGKSTARTFATATVILDMGLNAYNTLNGIVSASYLFGVDSQDVDLRMRAVSGIMEFLLGSSVGMWVDLLLEIYGMLTGENPKQAIAIKFYKVLPGADNDKIDLAIARAEAEREKYNKANGTNLDQKSFNEKMNGNKTIGGRIKSGWNKLIGKKDKNDLSQYEVSDEEAKQWLANKKASQSKTATTTSTSQSTSASIDDYQGDDLIAHGPGPKKRYYGNTGLQSDARWKNYKLGKFPDGSTSTMETGGCGPTAMAMVSNSMGKNVSPLTMAKYAQVGGYIKDGGSTSGLFTNGAKALGMTAHEESKSSLRNSLKKGNPVVVSGSSTNSSSPYTAAGHVVVATGLDAKGNAIVNDPMRGPSSVKFSNLTNGMNRGWSYTNGVSYGTAAPAPTAPQAPNIPKAPKVTKTPASRKVDTHDIKSVVADPAPSVQTEGHKPGGLAANTTNDPYYDYNITYKDGTTVKTRSKATNSAKVKEETASNRINNQYIKRNPKLAKYDLKKSTFSNWKQIEKYIEDGFKPDSEGEKKWNTAKYYDGLNVFDLKCMVEFKPSLLSSQSLKLFSPVYAYFVSSGYFKNNKLIRKKTVQALINASGLTDLLGGNGRDNGYDYKNGRPFFSTSDPRWFNLPWAGSTVQKRGSDLASLAMIASTFGENLFTPNYITTHWLKRYPSWVNSKGINMTNAYADGGFNSLKSTQVDGKKLLTSHAASYNKIVSALKDNKPVIIQGYRYLNSIFGGNSDKSSIDTSKRDALSTIMGITANATSLVVNDPYTSLDDNSVFDLQLLKDKVGPDGEDVIKDAYVVTDPSGKGFTGKVDLNKKNTPDSDFKSVKDATGLGKIEAIFSNVAAVGSHLIDWIMDPSKGYRSIMEPNEFDDDKAANININTNATTTTDSSSTKKTTSATKKATSNKNTPVIGVPQNTKAKATKTPVVGVPQNTKSKSTNTPVVGVPMGSGSIDFDIPIAFGKKKKSAVLPLATPEPTLSSVSNGSAIVATPVKSHSSGKGKSLDKKKTSKKKKHSSGGGRSLDKKTTTNSKTTKKKKSDAANATDAVTDTSTVASSTPFEMTTSQKLNATIYANTAALMGGDYSTAYQEYQQKLQASMTASNGTNGDASADGTSAPWTTTEDPNGTVKQVPPGFGSVLPYMGWQCITSKTSNQYKLRAQAGQNFDANGFGIIGDRFTVAVKPYYGTIGDYLNVNLKDGTSYKVVVADQKGTENEPGNSLYNNASNAKQREMQVTNRVHTDGSVVEFVVDKSSWYHTSKTVKQFHPQWAQDISTIEKVGNYWTNDAKTAKGLGTAATYTVYGKKKKDKNKVGNNTSALMAQAAGDKANSTTETSGANNWLTVIQNVKAAIAAQHPGYSQSRYISIKVFGQTLNDVRTDCSGLVSACLRVYGSISSNMSSNSFVSASAIKGFSRMSWPGWDGLQPGDIIARNGHVEIYAGKVDGRHKVYNNGGDTSVNTAGMTNAGSSAFTVVWRPGNAGSFASSVYAGSSDAAAAGQTGTQISLDPFGGLASIFDSSINPGTTAYGPGPKSNSPQAWFTKTLDGKVSSVYGKRHSALGNEFHRGIDISAKQGKAIKSPVSGRVVSSGNDATGYGNYAIVQDRSGNNHIFAHMNKPVGYGVGSVVNKNDIIGEVGSTGRSTGPHLHYEIRKNGNKYSAFDPTSYKYDKDVSKSFNVNDVNTSSDIGGAERDIPTPQTNEFNMNTSKLESKMDSMVKAINRWVDSDSKNKKAGSNINQINNTTTNVAYGPGGKKTVTKSSKKSSDKQDILDSKSLENIHKLIASK